MPKSIPKGYHTLTAYLIIRNAVAALDFYREAFGAVEVMCLKGPDGRVNHAEMTVGDSKFMLAEECSMGGSPETLNGTSVSLLMYVQDVDAALDRAEAAGIKVLRPIQDQFYGDRSVTVQDPFGHIWTLATHKEDVSPEELQRRAAVIFGGEGAPSS